jgi:hypothetical protein
MPGLMVQQDNILMRTLRERIPLPLLRTDVVPRRRFIFHVAVHITVAIHQL